MDNFDLRKYLAEGRLFEENKYDIDDPNSPLGQLNDNDQDVAILNNMTKKYGLDVVLMWMSSGEYGDREYFEEGKLLKEDVEKISNEEFTIVFNADDMTDYEVYNRLLSDDEADEAEEEFKMLDDDIETFVLDSETPAREILDYASSQEELEDYGLSKYWKFK